MSSMIYSTELTDCMKKIYRFFISYFLGTPNIFPGTKNSVIIENLSVYLGISVDDIKSIYLLDISKYKNRKFDNIVFLFVNGNNNKELKDYYSLTDYNINDTKTLYCCIDDSVIFEAQSEDYKDRLHTLFMRIVSIISCIYDMSIYHRFTITPAFITSIFIFDFILKDKEMLYKISKEIPEEPYIFDSTMDKCNVKVLNEKIKTFEAKILNSYEIQDALYNLYECLDIVNFASDKED